MEPFALRVQDKLLIVFWTSFFSTRTCPPKIVSCLPSPKPFYPVSDRPQLCFFHFPPAGKAIHYPWASFSFQLGLGQTRRIFVPPPSTDRFSFFFRTPGISKSAEGNPIPFLAKDKRCATLETRGPSRGEDFRCSSFGRKLDLTKRRLPRRVEASFSRNHFRGSVLADGVASFFLAPSQDDCSTAYDHIPSTWYVLFHPCVLIL